MTSVRLALLALALAACAKQAAVRAPAAPTTTTTKDIYHLCDDALFEALCTPASHASPMQVDTNLESTRARNAFAG